MTLEKSNNAGLCFGIAFVALLGPMSMGHAIAGGGPLGIDHKLAYDNAGIWKRSNQTALLGLMAGTEILGALWEGSDTRLGKTYWRSIDATIVGGASSAVLKEAFARSRPSQTDNPNDWFKGNGHYSFPSGEVTVTSAIVTPFILEYGHEMPEIWALAALPAYDAVARMKVQAHWQTDVLAGAALGAASGYYAFHRDSPFTLMVVPHGLSVGFKTRW